MSSTKEIQRRIKSVESTQKITRAMEMVAATKMRRAVEAVFQTRRYANLGWSTALNISSTINRNTDSPHPFLKPPKKVKKIGVILITSNRGLCGGFNTNLAEEMDNSIKSYKQQYETDLKTDILLMGKKGYIADKYYGYSISAEFSKKDSSPDFQEVTPVTKTAMDNFSAGSYDKVFIAYTDYISASKQLPRLKQILPINIESKDPYLGEAEHFFGQFESAKNRESKEDDFISTEYTFEPSAQEILNDMLPRLIETQLFQALLESNASEHSIRMATMHQATDAAEDMINELQLTYNKERQASITREISEISACVDALSQE